MSIVVQSRFACLKTEEEEPAPKPQTSAQKDNKNKKDKEKDKKNSTNNNTSKQSNKKQKAVKLATARQWEEWKQKDETLVNGNFEQDLENALMLSKIHYEENKEKYSKTEDVKGKKIEKKKNNKKTISLDVFLAGEPTKESNDTTSCEKEPKENFFEKISEDTKQVLNNEKFKDLVRDRQNVIDEVISSAQYKEKLDIERKKSEVLKEELEQCKSEITAVKERNKTLYTLLSTGEMKGKAEIIDDLEKLTVIKDELTQEVARLHGLLEQERSKVAALTNEKPTHKKSAKKHS